MNRRLPHSFAQPTLVRGNDRPRPACEGESLLFSELIDHPGKFALRAEAARFCGPCPLRDTCLPENIERGGSDREWAQAVTTELARLKARPCERCGKSMDVSPNGGTRRRYCGAACSVAARRARERAA